jgi:uncharacterized protein
MIQRVVFDTSTLVGAVLRRGSTPRKALNLALSRCELCASIETLAELETVLARPHFLRYAPAEARLAFASLVRTGSRMISIDASSLLDVQPACRDPKDNVFLAIALVVRADVIVSSDHDLLALHPWNGIPILTSSQFVSQFSV